MNLNSKKAFVHIYVPEKILKYIFFNSTAALYGKKGFCMEKKSYQPLNALSQG